MSEKQRIYVTKHLIRCRELTVLLICACLTLLILCTLGMHS